MLLLKNKITKVVFVLFSISFLYGNVSNQKTETKFIISNNNLNYIEKNKDLYLLHQFAIAYNNLKNSTNDFQDKEIELENIKKEIESFDEFSISYKTIKMLELAESISKSDADLEEIKSYIQKNIIETIEVALKETVISEDDSILIETDKQIIYFFRIYSQIQLEINILINELNLKEEAIAASKISSEDFKEIKSLRNKIIERK